jgi:hypothetical protein
MSPKGGGGGRAVSANEYSCAHGAQLDVFFVSLWTSMKDLKHQRSLQSSKNRAFNSPVLHFWAMLTLLHAGFGSEFRIHYHQNADQVRIWIQIESVKLHLSELGLKYMGRQIL